MKYYLIRLCLTLGEYEKHTTHFIKGLCEKEAQLLALCNECHGNILDTSLDLKAEEFTVEDMWGEMLYRVDSCQEVDAEDVDNLAKYLGIAFGGMSTTRIYHLFNNLIEGDIHTTIDFIIHHDSSRTPKELLEMYDTFQ